ncbi:MAG: hypothetical protein COV72_00035 [Candidatus Omnitrophica bacterium CG11_big_fil_rev_8_21_14_0_20_42_13]|uniref:Response regulatory domain-containing protein n=1 Tax=Candidatus Ghiorseimicrobium undicola TaxID=1974746 RepID=A0A2H0M059_9BACT|nr:MAG: hypothetical protein COV72_00035 [Candidatus Omnitrophica bacterium CG11_big_fil_rev_8_21_14_0_20_42_13]
MDAKILVIDDEALIVKMVENRLKASGYQVITASNGQEGLDKLQKEKPDLIILDVLMPVMGGFDFYKAIKKDPKNKNIPIIVLTARSAMKDVFLGLDIDDFISKPFEPAELLSKVEASLIKKALLLCDDPFVTDKMTPPIKSNGYEIEIVKDEESMLEKGKGVKYKILIIHLPLLKKGPKELAAAILKLKSSGSKVILYCDVHVKGAENNNSFAIGEVKNEWAKAGFKDFFDSRISPVPFADFVNSMII